MFAGLVGIGLAITALALFTQWKAREIARRFPPRGAIVAVDGGRVHLVDTPAQGAQRPRAIVLVHGASGNEADMRLPLAQGFAALGFRVISVDRPGHGWSGRDDAGDCSPARQAALIRRAVESVGVREAIIVGHSLAGALSLQLALDHASFARGVMLLSAVTHPWPGGVALYYRVAAAPVVGPLFTHTLALPAGLALMAPTLRSVYAPQAPPKDYRARTGVDLVLRPRTFRNNACDVVVMEEFVRREQSRYGRIEVPVSIVTGNADSVVLTHVHSGGSARDIPGATMTVLEGVGHGPHWARPDAVIAAIVALDARITAARPAP